MKSWNASDFGKVEEIKTALLQLEKEHSISYSEEIEWLYSLKYRESHMMRLWKVHIKTYHFGVLYYDLFVLADTESNMLRIVYKYPSYSKDEDAEVITYEEINLNDSENRVL